VRGSAEEGRDIKYPNSNENEITSMSKESKRKAMDRRTFLKFAGGGALAVAAAACCGSVRQVSMAGMENRVSRMIATQQLLPEVFADEESVDETCTTIVVGKNATADGSVLMSHNEDDGSWNEGNVYLVPHQTHAPGEVYAGYFGVNIPQPPETYRYIWIGDPNPNGIPGDFYNGINEYQVTICENVAASKETWGPGWFAPPSGPPGPPPSNQPPQVALYKLIWTDFMHLVMQRCKTALEGV
jgi:hypothetical protein